MLFTASKDTNPNVWYSLNGERLGTFNGHQGAVWCIDVDWMTTRFMSGAGDDVLKIWDCQTGSQIASINNNTAVRTCQFSFSANMAAYSTDMTKKTQSEINIIDTRNVDESLAHADPILKIKLPNGEKVCSLLWGTLDEFVITGQESGELIQWDLKVSEKFSLSFCCFFCIVIIHPTI